MGSRKFALLCTHVRGAFVQAGDVVAKVADETQKYTEKVTQMKQGSSKSTIVRYNMMVALEFPVIQYHLALERKQLATFMILLLVVLFCVQICKNESKDWTLNFVRREKEGDVQSFWADSVSSFLIMDNGETTRAYITEACAAIR